MITLSNGIEVEIKDINLAGNYVDYRRVNDPVYTGDCRLDIEIASLETAEDEIKVALETALVTHTAEQTAYLAGVRNAANFVVVKNLRVNRKLKQGKIAEAIKIKGGL